MKKIIAVAVLTTLAGFALGFFCGFRRGAIPPAPTAPSPEMVSKLLATMNEDWDFSEVDPITRKHMTLQLWYAHQAQATGLLSTESGHEFGPIWMRRSPATILEEQAEFMKQWLKDLETMERKEHPVPPGTESFFPPESARDPADKSRIDWEDYLDSSDGVPSRIWIGKSARNGAWMAYERAKGVYEPDGHLLALIRVHEEKSQRHDPVETPNQ